MVLVIVILNDDIKDDHTARLASALHLQVSTIHQALIFVTRSRGWSFTERPGLLLVFAFILAQLVATDMSALVNFDMIGIRIIGWRWTGVIWLYNTLTYLLLDPIKFGTAFTSQKDFGKEICEAAWAAEQQTFHGLQSSEKKMFTERGTFRDINLMAEEAKRRAEKVRLRDVHTLKGRVESFAKLRGLDTDANNHHYTV